MKLLCSQSYFHVKLFLEQCALQYKVSKEKYDDYLFVKKLQKPVHILSYVGNNVVFRP